MNEWSFDIELIFIRANISSDLGVHFFYNGGYLYGTAGHLVDFPTLDMSTWTGQQHFDITRDSDGRICIYHNDTILIDYAPSSTSTPTSEYFWLGFGLTTPWSGTPLYYGAIDNIIVSDTVDITTPPQLPFYEQTWFLATVGVVIIVVVVVIVISLRRKKN